MSTGGLSGRYTKQSSSLQHEIALRIAIKQVGFDVTTITSVHLSKIAGLLEWAFMVVVELMEHNTLCVALTHLVIASLIILFLYT
jgi:hypothetical protein